MAGRKPKYDLDKLTIEIAKYREKYPHKKIKLSDLERETGIPRHIWRDNAKLLETVEEVNKVPIVANPDNMEMVLPSAEEIVEHNYPNKQGIISSVQDCLDIIQSLYEKALLGTNNEEIINGYKQQIDELKAIIRLKDKEINNLQNRLDSLYIGSESPTKRKQNGLKENLIEINFNNKKELSKNPLDIQNEFKDLFD